MSTGRFCKVLHSWKHVLECRGTRALQKGLGTQLVDVPARNAHAVRSPLANKEEIAVIGAAPTRPVKVSAPLLSSGLFTENRVGNLRSSATSRWNTVLPKGSLNFDLQTNGK